MPFLDRPVTGLEFLFFIIVAAVAAFVIFLMRRPKPIWESEMGHTGTSWKKMAPYLGLLAFVILYPFVPPFLHWITGIFYGAGTSDGLGNVSSADIVADQVAGGGVQLGTFFTKLWITVIFYLLATGLPWWVQQFTHPAPTAWAKGTTDPVTGLALAGYKVDFSALDGKSKFEAYGRLQYVNTAKFIGASLAAALLV